MSAAAKSSHQASKARQKLTLEHRARSVPHKKPFVFAVIATLLFYLGLIAFITGVFAFFNSPKELKQGAADILVAIPPVCGVLWMIAYIMRRRAICPLCRSTPLLDNLAHKHQKALRCKPFNFGTTAILSVLFTQHFRCMHCGTPFDLLKPKTEGR